MSELAFSGGQPPAAVPVPARAGTDADKASRRWRSIWRIHFYAGIFAAPILLVLAVSGLVIMYTQPINDAYDGMRTVPVGERTVSYDVQAEAVTETFPDNVITAVVTPVDDTHATAFTLDNGRDVFVDPYTGEVTGSVPVEGGVVGLANRFHGFLNAEQFTVPVPTLGGVLGDEPAFTDIPIGDLLVELFACWALVLAASGIYLWWPRKSGTGKALFVPRLGKQGRAKWRDLHAVPGFILSFVLIFFVVSGLPWSGFWGANFNYVAEEVDPANFDAPSSKVAELGDEDRFGNRINWVFQGTDIPVSTGGSGAHHSSAPPTSGESVAAGDPVAAKLSLNGVIQAGFDEGLKRGYTLTYPADVENEDGSVTYGTYAAANPWPDRTQDARTFFFDQFTGETIDSRAVGGYGAVWRATDYTISTHMGTQFGLVNRILMTFACLALIWAVISAAVMYTKRRRPGTAGLPRRPRDLKLANRLILIAVILGLIYPLFGLSALVVLAFDRFVIRRWGRSRRAFGQHDAAPDAEDEGDMAPGADAEEAPAPA